MNVRIIPAAALAVLSFGAIAGCGGAADSRSEQGLRAASAAFDKAVESGNGELACSYMTTAARAMTVVLGDSCAEAMGSAADGKNEEIKSVKITGNTASYTSTDTDTGRAVYSGGRWLFDLSD